MPAVGTTSGKPETVEAAQNQAAAHAASHAAAQAAATAAAIGQAAASAAAGTAAVAEAVPSAYPPSGSSGSRTHSSKPAPLAPAKPYKPPKIPTGSMFDDTIIGTKNKDARALAASSFEKSATYNLALHSYDFTKHGELKTKETEVPVPKAGVTNKDIAKASARLDQKLAEIKAKVPHEVYLKQVKPVAMAGLANSLYKKDEKGAVLTKVIEQPKLRVTPESYTKDLKTIQQTADDIRAGTHGHANLPDFAKPAWEVEGSVDQPVLSAATPTHTTKGQEAARQDAEMAAAEQYLAGKTVENIKEAGFIDPPSVGQTLANVVGSVPAKVANGAVHGLLEGLTRPGAAFETFVGKQLVNPHVPIAGWDLPGGGLIHGDNARKIENAVSPWEAFKTGYGGPHHVSGDELMGGLFKLPEQTGIIADIATDPLMYLGGAGLLRKGATEAAQLGERIRAVDATLLNTAEVTRLTSAASKSGNFDELVTHLRKLADRHGISTSKFNPAVLRTNARVNRAIEKGKGPLKSRYGPTVENDALHRDLRATMDAAPETTRYGRWRARKGKKVTLPGQMAGDNVARVVRSQAHNQELISGARLRLMWPTGKEFGHIPIKIPERLANARVIPVGIRPLSKEGGISRQALHTRQMTEGGTRAAEIDRTVQRLEGELQTARVEHDTIRINELEHALKVERDSLGMARAQAVGDNFKRPHLISAQEIVNAKNRNRGLHEAFRVSANEGRLMETQLQQHIKRATDPLRHDPISLLRVSLFRQGRHDTGASQLLRNLPPLTKKESHAVEQLDQIDKAMGAHGVKAGTTQTLLEDYATRLVQKSGHALGSTTDDVMKELNDMPIGASQAGKSFAQHHRAQAEMASLADPNILGQAIHLAGKGSVSESEARALADVWHRIGRVRLPLESIARRIQRQGPLDAEALLGLTSTERRAHAWSKNIGEEADQPFFAAVGTTEEPLMGLHPGVPGRFGGRFEADPFVATDDFQATLRKYHSAQVDRSRFTEAMKHMKPSDPVYKDYQQIVERLDKEIADYGLTGKSFGTTPEADAQMVKAQRAADLAASKVPAAERAVIEQEGVVKGVEGSIKDVEAKIAKAPRTADRAEKGKVAATAEDRLTQLEADAIKNEALHKKLLHARDNFYELSLAQGTARLREVSQADLTSGMHVDHYGEVRQIDQVHPVGDGTDVSFVGHSIDEATHYQPGERVFEVQKGTIRVGNHSYDADQIESFFDLVARKRDTLDYKITEAENAVRASKASKTTPAELRSLRAKKGALTKQLKKENEILTKKKRQYAYAKGQVTATNKVARQSEEALNRSRSVPKEVIDAWEKRGLKFGSDTPLTKIVAADYEKLANRGSHSYSEADAPLPGMVPLESHGWGEDPFDATNFLPDVRQDKLFYEMDPRKAMYHRARVESGATTYVARWKGLDEARGISAGEASGHIATFTDGTKLPTSRLKREYEHGNLVGYRDREDPATFWPKKDVSIPRLVPVSYRSDSNAVEIWFNPADELEYMRPVDMDKSPLGQAIQETIGQDRLWPTALMRDIKHEQARAAGKNAQAYDAIFQNGMDTLGKRMLSMIRWGVTVPFPAYWIRNITSDVLKSLQAGTGVIFHPIMNAKLAKLAVTRGGKGLLKVPGFSQKMTPAEFLFMAETFGIRSGQHMAEFSHIADGTKPPGRLREWANLGPKSKFGSALTDLGTRREDMTRFITFFHRMRTNGGDVADATWYMIKHHFDYGDLTATERNVARNTFLFYTWYRKNIPLQFAEMISRPGFFAAVGHLYEDTAEGQTPLNFDWSKISSFLPDMSGRARMRGLVPDYFTQQLGGFITNWNDHTASFATGAPWVDMNLIVNFAEDPGSTGRQWFSMLNPAIPIATQLLFQKDTLVGRDFRPNEPTAPVIAKFASLLGIPVSTDKYGRPEIPWQANVLFKSLPVVGRGAGYFVEPTNLATDSGTIQSKRSLISAALGINSFMSVSPDRYNEAAQQLLKAKLGEMQNYVQGLSSETPENRDKMTKEWVRKNLKPFIDEHNIPMSVQQDTEGAPKYISQTDREAKKSTVDLGSTGSSTPDFGNSKLKGYDFGSTSSTPDFTPQTNDKPAGPVELRPTGARFGGDPKEPVKGKTTAAEPHQASPADRSGPVVSAEQQHANQKAKLVSTSEGASKGASSTAETVANEMTAAVKDLSAVLHGTQPIDQKRKEVATRLVKAIANSVPEVSSYDDGPDSAKLAAASIKWGKKYGIPPSVLYGQQGIESGWGANLGPSTAGAQGWTQFMPETRKYYMDNYGIDAYGSLDESVQAQAKYLQVAGYADDPYKAIYAYNHADWYVNEVQDAAKNYTELDNMPAIDHNIPQGLVSKSKHILGDDAVKAIVAGGKIVTAPKHADEPSKNAQKWGGSVGAIQAVVPQKYWYAMRGDKRTPDENTAVGGAADSDHLTTNTNSFGADFSFPSDDLTEDDAWKIARAVADNLGLESETGLQTVDKGGVRYQLIWQAEGHYDHVHVGAEVIDPNNVPNVPPATVPIKGTNLAVKLAPPEISPTTSTSTGTTSTTPSYAPTTPTGQTDPVPQYKSDTHGPKSAPRLSYRLSDFSDHILPGVAAAQANAQLGFSTPTADYGFTPIDVPTVEDIPDTYLPHF